MEQQAKIITKADYCSAKFNRRLVLLGIRENFPAKTLDSQLGKFSLENNPLYGISKKENVLKENISVVISVRLLSPVAI